MIAPVGYGCAMLGGSVPEQRSKALLDHCVASGVTHFDVAPSYGNGNAEKILGEWMAQRRFSGTVATKVGIPLGAHDSTVRFSGLIPRRVKIYVNRQRAKAVKISNGPSSTPTNFEPDTVRNRVIESTRLLRRPLDLVHLHEFRPEDFTGQLQEVINDLRRGGYVQRFGVASSHAGVARFVADHGDTFSVLQQRGGPLNNPETHSGSGGAIYQEIYHSILGPAGAWLEVLLRCLSQSDMHRRRWLEVVGGTMARDDVAAGLFRVVRGLTPTATVLFQSSSSSRITRNIQALDHGLDFQSAVVADATVRQLISELHPK